MQDLKDWQRERLYNPVMAALRNHRVAVCGGCTGSGKSYIGAHLLAEMAPANAVYVCPKITHTSISRLVPAGTAVINIEMLRTGNTPYLTRHGDQFIWDPEIELIIFDEAHQCRGTDKPTLNSTVLCATKQLVKRSGVITQHEIPTVLMTATLAESPLHLRQIGKRLGLFHPSQVGAWIQQHGCRVRQIRTARGVRSFYEFPPPPGNKKYLERLINELYPKFGGFVTPDDIPSFPESELHAELFDIDPKDLRAIQSLYEEIKLKHTTSFEVLPKRLYGRQLAELSKVEVFASLAESAVEEGNSAVIFVNFTNTRVELGRRLDKHNPCMIYGEQNDRSSQLQRFMDEQTRIAIVMIQAGGTGLDELSDAHRPGARPRVSFISPCDSSTQFLQCVGRLVRMNTVHKVFQTIVLAANTVEERVKRNLDNKLSNLSTLTDMDLLYEGEIHET